MSCATNREGTAKNGAAAACLLRSYDTLCEARESLISLEYVLYRMVTADEMEHDGEHRLDAILELVRRNSRRVGEAIALMDEAHGE